MTTPQKYDVFISHASEDKDRFVRPLAVALEEAGVSVWYDEHCLTLGDSLRGSIDRGLAQSRFGVVVLSPVYFEKDWTLNELGAIFAKEIGGQKVILPIWHGISRDMVIEKSSMITDRVAVRSEDGMPQVLSKILEVIRPRSPIPKTPSHGLEERHGIPHNLPRSGSKKFIGRAKQIDKLDSLLGQDKGPVAIAASIKGMGGIGKTELAIQYAGQRLHNYPGGVCWSKVRENDAAAQILNFAFISLGIKIPDEIQQAEDRVQWLWRRWPNSSDTLIIFDDVIDYASVEKLLPPSPSQFTVLMTTRNQLGGAVESLDLEVLSIWEAQSLLISCIGKKLPKGSKEKATELCKRLGRLPLAIELVGRYMSSKPHLSFEELIQRLNDQGLSHRSMKEADHGMTGNLGVESALGLTWDELGDKSKDLALFLGLFALAPIPWELIPECLPEEDPEDLEDTLVQELTGRSLVKRTVEGFVELHQLVWEFFRKKLDEDPGMKEKGKQFAKVMADVARKIPQVLTLDHVEKFRPMVPHLEEVCELRMEELEDDDLKWPFSGLGRFYEGQVLYSEAESWRQICLNTTKERFGEEHPDVATSLNNLAVLYRFQGRYEKAEPLHVQSLEMRRKLLGEEHPDVALSFHNLADLYDSLGCYEKAEPLYVQSLEMRRKLLGEEHPDLPDSLHNLAAVYCNQGRYEKAEPLYVQAIEMRRKFFGEKHPHIALSINGLALLYCKQRRYEEAESLYEKALEMNLKLLGEEHPDLALNLNDLARLYHVQGRYEDAEPLYVKALETYTKKLGPDHPYTVIVRGNFESLLKKRDEK